MSQQICSVWLAIKLELARLAREPNHKKYDKENIKASEQETQSTYTLNNR
jgi:hypothetical protein